MNLHAIINNDKVWAVRATNDDGYALLWLVQTNSRDEAQHIADLLDQAGFYNAEADEITDGWITSYEATRHEIINDYELVDA